MQILQKVIEIQKEYPDTVLGGSLGLIIQGVRIPEREHDIDLIVSSLIPYSASETKDGSADFTSSAVVDGFKIEQRVAPEEINNFRLVTFLGQSFKVKPIEDILSHKLRYNNEKHRDDLLFMLGVPYYPKITASSNLPF